MLEYQLLKKHSGILLIGDYVTLRHLHNVVHDVNERSPLIQDKDGDFLGLAYDVRKAYERQREIVQPPVGYEEIGVRFGVEIIWPVLLVQQTMLRASLGYIDHSKRHQAVTFALEAAIEEALREDFGAQGETIVDRWLRLAPTQDTLDRLDSRGAIFCSWSGAERKRRFASLLSTFDPLYPALPNGSQDPNFVSPEELNQWEDVDWPDPI